MRRKPILLVVLTVAEDIVEQNQRARRVGIDRITAIFVVFLLLPAIFVHLCTPDAGQYKSFCIFIFCCTSDPSASYMRCTCVYVCMTACEDASKYTRGGGVVALPACLAIYLYILSALLLPARAVRWIVVKGEGMREIVLVLQRLT